MTTKGISYQVFWKFDRILYSLKFAKIFFKMPHDNSNSSSRHLLCCGSCASEISNLGNDKFSWHSQWICISFCFIIHRTAIFKAVFHMSKLRHVLQTECIRHQIVPKKRNNISTLNTDASLAVAVLDKCPSFDLGNKYLIAKQSLSHLSFW